jgi:hypothetical protein
VGRAPAAFVSGLLQHAAGARLAGDHPLSVTADIASEVNFRARYRSIFFSTESSYGNRSNRTKGTTSMMLIHLSRNLLVSTLAMLVLFAGIGLPRDSAAEDKPQVVHQLRIYELFEDTREAFHERFRDHARRIMERYDFRIVAMWESRTAERIEFVYLLEWPDEKTMTDRWAAFLADREWSDIKAETSRLHGRFVGDIEDRTLLLTDYSPDTALLPRK